MPILVRAAVRAARCLMMASLVLVAVTVHGSEISLPMPRQSAEIKVRAGQANSWRQGEYEVWVLRDGCEVVQDGFSARGQECVLWIDRAEPISNGISKVLAYFEGGVVVSSSRGGATHRETGQSADSLRSLQWLGRLYTTTEIAIDAPVTGFEPQVKPAILQRGLLARETEIERPVQQAQYTENAPGAMPSPPPTSPMPSGPQSLPWPSSTPPVGPGTPAPYQVIPAPGASVPYEVIPAPGPQNRPTARSILIQSRSNVRMQARVFPSPDGRETIAMISSGVNVVVDGVENVAGLREGKIDIETDRIVIWTAPIDRWDLSGQSSGETLQAKDAPLEFYMEGNIVFREGDRVIYAERMYYNVRGRYGIVLNAEVLTPAPGYAGLIRLKANVLQQLDEFNFRAFDASLTSSRIGVPRYWLQAKEVSFQDIQTVRATPFTGQIVPDGVTAEPAVDHQYLATSRNNFLYLGGLPVFYWPTMATDLGKPNYYINSLNVGNDNVFGFHAMADWDMYQLFGIRNAPDGTEWSISTDYLDDRGFGLGTNYRYDRFGLFGMPGPVTGEFDAWGINDTGFDNLGLGRRHLMPTTENRGRILWFHRQHLPRGFQFTAELGLVSDNNFLEQYYEREWDTRKDQTTGIELKQYNLNSSWAIRSDIRLNEYFTQSEWLPRLDHFILGQPILNYLSWSAHSSVGYGRIQTATLPPPPNEPAQDSLPWEEGVLGRYDKREGLRAATRHELGLPVPLGPFKFTPYVAGELAFWSEDVDGTEVSRAYGQAGIRGSIPFWSVNHDTRSTLLNLNGLAHKVVLDADFFWADSDQPMTRFPLYDPLDDDSEEHFQRRFIENLYGSTANLPWQYDARNYALRSGMQNWVTGPSVEIADDLAVGKVGLRQRWQTKRGYPGRERIVDWISLDIESSFFPEQERDNFGEVAGLLNYDFRWHVGDRFTILSDGYADLFPDGLKTASVGWKLNRPGRGSLYLGYRSIQGPFDSDLIHAALDYRLSEKWIVKAGGIVDLGATGNISEHFSLTRVGESFLIRIGANMNHSRDNFGLTFAVEPRFLPHSVSQFARGISYLGSGMGTVGGVPIPPAGAFGVD